MSDLRITEVISEVFEWERPAVWNGSHVYGYGSLHKVTVRTDEGISGFGWNGGTAAVRPQRLMPGFVDYYRPMLIGRDPCGTEGLVTDLWEKQIKILGASGLHTQVLAAIVIACWDIRGKAAGASVHKLLGGAKKSIRAYIAGGYYAAGKGLAELADEVRYNVDVLHATAVKIKIGDPEAGFAEDMRRVAAAREAIGSEVDLLADANCSCDLETALAFARELAEYGVYWFEEPLPIYDFEAHQRLADASEVKIAVGENYYSLADFRSIIAHRGAQIFNVDVAICPGYDVAREVAELADDAGLTIVPHGCQELQLPLVAGVENGEMLEYYPPEVDPIRGEMFEPRLVLEKNGMVTVPERPGIGYEINDELLAAHRVL